MREWMWANPELFVWVTCVSTVIVGLSLVVACFSVKPGGDDE